MPHYVVCPKNNNIPHVQNQRCGTFKVKKGPSLRTELATKHKKCQKKKVRQPTQCLISDIAAERILKAGYGEDDSLQQLTERGKFPLLLLRAAVTTTLLLWSLSLLCAVALRLCTVVAAAPLLLRWSLSLL